jgi:hypothetical protein
MIVAVGTCTAGRGAEVSIGAAQADFNAGQYRSCLQKIAQVLNSKAAAPGSPARYDLLMLRGECMLQLKEADLAASAFTSASTVFKGEGDLKRMAAARAMSVLVKASPRLQYKGSKDAQPIDIVTPDSRKQAMMALFDDRFATTTSKIEAAMKSNSLVPIHDLFPVMGDLYALELTATGDTARTMPAIRSVGEHARQLITAELDRLRKRVDELDDLANAPTLSSGNLNQTLSYRGLNSNERNELHDAADELVKIEKVAQEGRRIAQRLAGPVGAWDAILGECNDVKDVAQQAYDRRY